MIGSNPVGYNGSGPGRSPRYHLIPGKPLISFLGGSLNYETTLFVFSACIEKMIQCRDCGNVYQEILYKDVVAVTKLKRPCVIR